MGEDFEARRHGAAVFGEGYDDSPRYRLLPDRFRGADRAAVQGVTKAGGRRLEGQKKHGAASSVASGRQTARRWPTISPRRTWERNVT